MTENSKARHATSYARFESIDVLRGFAALTVVFSHYFPFWNRYLGDVVVIVPAQFGYYAVNLFFVISGMVIFMTLEKCNSVFDFAVLRFSRLYPAYWATLILATIVVVAIFENPFWAGGFVINATMFQEFFRFPNLDNVYWSLTVELAFYLNVAWLLALGLHNRINGCIAGWLFLSGIWALLLHDPSRDDRDWFSILLALDYAPFFAIGILFYEGRGRLWRPIELGLFAAALLVEYLIASWEGLAVAVISSILVFAAMKGILNFATNRITLWLGTISYSLYLIHRNIAYNLLPWLHEHGFGPLTSITITTVGILALAASVTFWVEKPASRKIRIHFRK